MGMTQTKDPQTIAIRTTSNGHTVELRRGGNTNYPHVVRTATFRGEYATAEYAAHVANILFVELETGCYACGVAAANAKRPHLAVLDTSKHSH
jgi:hypothetical protein